MDVSNDNKSAVLQDPTQDQDTRIEDFTQCCLCGSDLTFKHLVDYAKLSVREDAHCPACRIRLRARDHILH